MTLTILSWFATALSLLGNLGVNYQKVWGFYIWILSNIFWVIVALSTPNYAQVFMFVAYAGLNVMGIIKWNKLERSKNNER